MQRHWAIVLSVVTFVAGLWLSPLIHDLLTADDADDLEVTQGPAVVMPFTATDAVGGSRDLPTLSELYERLTPSVVNISVLIADPGRGGHFLGIDSYTPLRESRGSGVVLTTDGAVLTNHHVVSGARQVQVQLADGRSFPASVVGAHEGSDLALLQIESDDELQLQPAVLGNSDELRVGEWVFAIGNPFGLNHSLTTGIVSYLGRPAGNEELLFDFIQTDTAINPGNSGGPLFNLSGEVIGISSAVLGNAQGIGFCIPIDIAKKVVPVLMEDGEFHRGYLGVTLAALEDEGPVRGVRISRVFEGTPAAQAGFQPGDTLLAFGDDSIDEPGDVSQVVGLTPPGREVIAEIERDGQPLALTVVVGDFDALTQVGDVQMPSLGISARLSTEEDRRRARVAAGSGVTVAGVDPDGPSAGSLAQGDMIIELDYEPIADPHRLATLIRQPGRHLLLVSRRGRVFPLWVR